MEHLLYKEQAKYIFPIIRWILGCIYGAILFWLNLRRIFDNNFWGDEVFTIRLSRMRFFEMLNATANDVHPPLYYIITTILRFVFGENGTTYHLSALLAYTIVMVIAITLIWKKWGGSSAIVLMTFASLLPRAVEYNVEARMYSWGSMFILLSFLSLYYTIENNHPKNYMCFALFSLCAAYTHYYCLISVAFFYIVLSVWSFINRNKTKGVFKNTLITNIITILIYLPWLLVLIKTFARTSDNYWITDIPELPACLKYIFSGRTEKQLLIIFFLLTIIYFVYIFMKKDKEMFTTEWIWYSSGIFSIIGTVFIGISVSKIFRPMFLLRYLYPVSIVAWLLVGISISHFKGKLVYSIIIASFIIKGNLASYRNLYNGNRYQNELLNKTLKATSEIDDGDIVYSDFSSIVWGVGSYYYPNTTFRNFTVSNNFPDLTENKNYYFMVTKPFDNDYIELLQLTGKRLSSLVQEGIIGTYTVYIYKLD